jgi:hypothetical protein
MKNIIDMLLEERENQDLKYRLVKKYFYSILHEEISVKYVSKEDLYTVASDNNTLLYLIAKHFVNAVFEKFNIYNVSPEESYPLFEEAVARYASVEEYEKSKDKMYRACTKALLFECYYFKHPEISTTNTVKTRSRN